MGASANTAGIVAVSPSWLSQMLTIAAGRPWASSDDVMEDPANLGFVLRIYDRSNRAKYFQQTNPLLQVPMPVAHADYGGRLCLNFTGTQYYDYSEPASAVRYCHDGTGFESTHVYTRALVSGTQVIASTNNLAAATGYCHWLNVTPSARLFVANATTTVSSIGAAAPGVDVPTHSTLVYDESLASGSRARVYVKSTLGSQANSGATPAPGDSIAVLRIGAASSGAAGFIGRWREGIWSPTLSDVRRTRKFSLIQIETTIAP